MKLSISSYGTGKFNLASAAANESFRNVDIPLIEFAKSISAGHAFCAQLKGKRCKENFLATQFVAQDFDHWTLEEAKAFPFIREHGSLIYTTPSHRKDGNGDRFRVVYELEEAIEDADDYQMLIKAVLEAVPQADKACSDIARVYFGSKDCEMEILNGSY